MRFILNLKKLNKFITAPHFKIEDMKIALKLLTRSCFMTKIDLKDGYFLIPVHKKHKKYLRFSFRGVLYEFNAIPFGLSTAPYLFTKLVKPVVAWLRQKGFKSVVYLDDFLMIGTSREECSENARETKNLLESLGLIINYEKSNFEPSHQCEFLGFILDSKKYLIYLTNKKRESIEKITRRLAKQKTEQIREVAKVIGTLVSACPGVQYGWLHTKNLEREKVLALHKNWGNFDKSMTISDEAKIDLKWWYENIQRSFNIIRDHRYTLEIFTDASLTGWGAFCRNQKAHGWWGKQTDASINALELEAAFNGLKCFAKNQSHCEILMRIDNTTAISYVNKMGGIRYPKLSKIARDIWKWCEERKIHIFASYINTKENTEADAESRKLPPETEWQLAEWAFSEIVKQFGKPKIDLFASSLNAKCKHFISWKKDPESIGVDAFTFSWKNLDFYAFPPFSLILRVLQKIIAEEAEGIVIVPYWPTQPWYPAFKALSKNSYITFEPDITLLSSPFSSEHPLSRKLTLVAARLSGKHT